MVPKGAMYSLQTIGLDNMPEGLMDIGGGVKTISPNAFTSDTAGAVGNQLSLMNLQQQIANAPLERKKLEIDTALRANELMNLDVQNLLQRANLQKAIGDEKRTQSKFFIDTLKELPGIFDVDFNAGVQALKSINPNAEATANDDGTITLSMPTQRVEIVDGEQQIVQGKENSRIVINPSRLTPEKRTSLENEWYGRVNNNSAIKDFAEISGSYKDLKGQLDLATGQGDIAAMWSFAKVNQPNTSLRPGQQATLENAGGLGSAFITLWNKALTSNAPVFGKKDSQERKNFENAAKINYDNARQSVLSIGKNAADVARQQGLNPRNILSPVGDIQVREFLETPQQRLDRVNKALGD